MPGRKRDGDVMVNCTPDNPLTIINRGPVRVGVRYDNLLSPGSDFFVELRVGKRRQRTALTKPHDHMQILKDVLEMLGFQPTATVSNIDYDEEWGNDD